jgi:uncharacterized protein with NRDE domain
MCIVAISHLSSKRYPLIVAANRDERHARASAPATWWQGPGSMLAGQDLVAGGTWIGLTATGRFAAVTNIFEPGAAATERSRGELVTRFLGSATTPSEYSAALVDEIDRYGPFNLLLREGDALQFVSNRHPPATLESGVHVFSNNAPGVEWSKVGALARVLDAAAVEHDIHQFLIERLGGPDARGPLERASESVFVLGDTFGTRCTTVLTIDVEGRARFVEQRYTPDGAIDGREEFEFDLE